MEDQKEWRLYEEFIPTLIKSAHFSGRQIDKVQSGRNNRMQGKSGVFHQIDVSFFETPKYPEGFIVTPTRVNLYLIECKCLSSKVGLGIVRNHRAVIEDVQQVQAQEVVVKGMVMTTLGVTPDAQKYADEYKIVIQPVPRHMQSFSLAFDSFLLAAAPLVVSG